MTTQEMDRGTTADAGRRDLAQLGLAGFLVLAGAVTVWDASQLEVGFADPVGPQAFPYVVGTGSLVLGLALAVAAALGSRGEVEGGEDVDLDQAADWGTVGRLVGVLVLTVLTVGWLGWAISGALLFAGSAWSLGSRTTVRDVVVGLVLSVGSWYGFVVGLGVPLAPGILDGIL